MKYRSRGEIIGAILESSRPGNTKTKIMYESYLSHDQLSTYLELLMNSDLLYHDAEDNRYRITELGMKFLNAVHAVNDLLNMGKIREERSSSFPKSTYVALKTNAR